MDQLITFGLALLVTLPLFYLQYIASRAAIEIEKAQCDDSDCEPGFTNYGGPM